MVSVLKHFTCIAISRRRTNNVTWICKYWCRKEYYLRSARNNKNRNSRCVPRKAHIYLIDFWKFHIDYLNQSITCSHLFHILMVDASLTRSDRKMAVLHLTFICALLSQIDNNWMYAFGAHSANIHLPATKIVRLISVRFMCCINKFK